MTATVSKIDNQNPASTQNKIEVDRLCEMFVHQAIADHLHSIKALDMRASEHWSRHVANAKRLANAQLSSRIIQKHL